MKENKYDDPAFFEQYKTMERSQKGLEGAGEWHQLQEMLPGFEGKRVLDLGCGFGWHCRYAAEQGAASAIGVDISHRMLEQARSMTCFDTIQYVECAVEDYEYKPDAVDVVLSSLTFHYVKDFYDLCGKIYGSLVPGGDFVFSAEHPVFTAQGDQQWYHKENGERLHWPVDRYYEEGARRAMFLGESMTKYHRTMETYLGTLLRFGFEIRDFKEARPPDEMMADDDMADELRRPMMILVRAQKI